MKIICVGRNYAAHAAELNNEIPEEPLFFLKPETALLPKNHPFYIPPFTNDLHYELEVVVKISRLGKSIAPEFAHKYYTEVGLGIDFTARDIQQKMKEKGWPWERAKAFDFSAPTSRKFIPISELPDPNNLSFQLHKNGEVVQDGNTKNMLFPIHSLIAEASKCFTLKIGDFLFTGTPEGVGQVQPGDHLQGYLEGQLLLDLKVY